MWSLLLIRELDAKEVVGGVLIGAKKRTVEKYQLFTERQELVRKYVERVFDVLQVRFGIVRGHTRLIKEEEIGFIIRACVILHNMIVEDKRKIYELAFDYNVVEGIVPEPTVNHDHHPYYETYF